MTSIPIIDGDGHILEDAGGISKFLPVPYNNRRQYAMFHLFLEEPDTLPTDWFQLVCSKDSETARARVICDYIAGMTDSFAIDEHRRLFSF